MGNRKPGDMPLPLTRLIHENFAILMMYAYSQPSIVRMLDAKFKGGWPFLNKALFSYPVEHIHRACLELGILLRVLDDEQNLSGYLKALPRPPWGELSSKMGLMNPSIFVISPTSCSIARTPLGTQKTKQSLYSFATVPIPRGGSKPKSAWSSLPSCVD